MGSVSTTILGTRNDLAVSAIAEECNTKTTMVVQTKLTAIRNILEKVLPVKHRGSVDRFILQASMNYGRGVSDPKTKSGYERVTMQSLIGAVMEAGSFGFALDGKFAYMIPYGNRATCQLDYQALIAMSIRNGVFKRMGAEFITENDVFSMADENGQQTYKFDKSLSGRQEAKVVGAFAWGVTVDGELCVEHADRSEIEKARLSSKAPDSPAWKNWYGRMSRKVPVKRLLNGRIDDPDADLSHAIEFDNADYVEGTVSPPPKGLTQSFADESPTIAIESEEQGQEEEVERRDPSEIVERLAVQFSEAETVDVCDELIGMAMQELDGHAAMLKIVRGMYESRTEELKGS